MSDIDNTPESETAPEISIVMIGPTGVGKTSLLASMYENFQAVAINLGCTFVVDNRSKAAINKGLHELQDMARGKRKKISNEVGIKGTTELREYDFILGIPWEKGTVEITLRFIDIPGGWYAGYGNPSKANESLSASTVSFWCVDATALMEDDGEHHAKINDPQAIFDCYQASLKNLTGKHHIHFTLMRSESYVWDMDKLTQQMQERYAKGKNCFIPKLSEQNFEITCSAVQTVGNVVFHRWDENEDPPRAEFVRKNNSAYSPAGCEYPIAIAIWYGLVAKLNEEYHKNRTIGQRIYGFFWKTDAIKRAEAIYKKLETLLDKVNTSYQISLQ